MKARNPIFTVILLFLFTAFSATAQTQYLDSTLKLPEHPRLLLLKGEEETIKKNIASDKNWAKVHQLILNQCDAFLTVAPLERIKIGRRLLDVSRECLRRVFFLSYAWRITQEPKYLKRAEQELLAASAFSDWNPSHFLDVGEMALGLAIGYDWLYHDLSEQSRTLIKTGILKMAWSHQWSRNTTVF